MPKLKYDDIYHITLDFIRLLSWIGEYGLIGDFGKACIYCEEGRFTSKKDSSWSTDGHLWHCTNKSCGKNILLRARSWFEHSHLSIADILGVQIAKFLH